MIGRNNKVKSWMQNIYEETEKIQNIFSHNLISSEDIGDNNYLNITDKFEDVLVLIEDILFELDNKTRSCLWQRMNGRNWYEMR